MLKGRLGLETTRIPHTDRFGLMWLEYGKVTVENGNLVFTTAGNEQLEAGAYELPCQQISNLLLGPGTTISHDALRILARQQTGLLAVGSGGVRLYAVSMPFGPDRSKLARQQVQLWSDETTRVDVARKMYEIRLGGKLPDYNRDINTLRGIEGNRMKKVYRELASQYGVSWSGRNYDRLNPENDNITNKAINHAATASYAAAQIAVASIGAIPQLGFIHENSSRAFALDIADMFRGTFTIPVAFRAAKKCQQRDDLKVEKETRSLAGKTLQKNDIIPQMIDRIKEILNVDDYSGNS